MSEKRGSMHDRRRAALQALYQFDCGREGEPDLVRAALAQQASGASGPDADPDSCQLAPDSIEPGFALAVHAWERRADADRAVSEFAAEWPTHRQPTIDRSILRLAHYEMAHGGVPHAVAINEAVELAKAFGTEKSASFINAVLDRVAERARGGGDVQGSA
jgi:N utilization substance protein B